MMISSIQDNQKELERCQKAVDERLRGFFTEGGKHAELLESMRYSLLAGGKHIRAAICIKFNEAAGGTIGSVLDAACAIEMLHTYTLIHDDLPCMDNDDLRRGKPSNHIVFGETIATLAGDALQAAAFETLLRSDIEPGSLVRMALVFAEAAGPEGVCGGQYLDLAGEGKKLSANDLLEIHRKKTAALISGAARMGVIAGGGSQMQIEAADAYAHHVGLAFQIRDDVLDCTATEVKLGKPIGSDRESGKTTFATLFGVDKCDDMIRSETEKAVQALSGNFSDTEFLVWLAGMLADRKY